MSKTFARSSLCALSMTITTAHAAEPPTNLDKPEGRLDIIAWPGYIERGQTDKQYDWVTQFEKETGCAVNVKTAATSDEMVSLMTKGGYDLVTASGDASLRLIMGKRVQSINTALITNWKTLDPRVVKGDWFNVGGKVYGTPYQWGPNLLMYNTKTFPTPPDSWQVVFVEQNLPDGKSNKGRVQAYDGPIYIADAALFVKATQPQLGISDPYQLTEEQYQAVLKVLRDQHSLIHRYWHDTTVQMSDFKNEGVVASSAWPYQANALKAEGQPVATVFPKEGVTGWADTTMLHSEAKHPVCAYKWMNWSLTPKVQGDVAAWGGVVFLHFPILIIAAYAFNTEDAAFSFPPQGLTLRWFSVAAQRSDILDAVTLSLKVAALATLMALVLGTLAAGALWRRDFFGKNAISLLLLLPIALPGIVTGLALLTAFKTINLEPGFFTIVVGHATFCVVVVFNNVIARFRRTSWSLVEASMDLGANGWQTFRYVVLPNLSSALLAGGMLAFALSFDEIIVTTFTAGHERTLPLWLLNQLGRPRDVPVTNVVALLVMLVTTLPILGAWWLTREGDNGQ